MIFDDLLGQRVLRYSVCQSLTRPSSLSFSQPPLIAHGDFSYCGISLPASLGVTLTCHPALLPSNEYICLLGTALLALSKSRLPASSLSLLSCRSLLPPPKTPVEHSLAIGHL